MAGSIQLSGSQQFDAQGRPLSGGLLYFFQSGTTTPQNAFQDQALTIPYPNPIVLAADGRVPFFYLADGLIKIRLTDILGVTVITADGLLVIGPSSGGGGGAAIDPNAVLATGDVKARYGTGVLSGFVRLNGRTIGSATSGATERANADAQALFEYLWATDPNLAVSSGRGASANADWLANKTIALPDMRGRTIAGMDDMGATAASRLTSSFWGATGTTLGAAGGTESHTLSSSTQLPAHNHGVTDTHSHGYSGSSTTGLENQSITVSASGTSGGQSVGHSHSIGSGGFAVITPGPGGSNVTSGATGNGFGNIPTTDGPTSDHTHSLSVSGAVTANHNHNFSWSGQTGGTNSGSITTNNTGSSAAFATAHPSMVMTIYMKL